MDLTTDPKAIDRNGATAVAPPQRSLPLARETTNIRAGQGASHVINATDRLASEIFPPSSPRSCFPSVRSPHAHRPRRP